MDEDKDKNYSNPDKSATTTVKENPHLAVLDGQKLGKALFDIQEDFRRRTYNQLPEYQAINQVLQKIDDVFRNRDELNRYRTILKFQIAGGRPEIVPNLETANLADMNKEIVHTQEQRLAEENRETKLVKNNARFWPRINQIFEQTPYAGRPMAEYLKDNQEDQSAEFYYESAKPGTVSARPIDTVKKSQFEQKELSEQAKQQAIEEAKELVNRSANIIQFEKPSQPVESEATPEPTPKTPPKPWWRIW